MFNLISTLSRSLFKLFVLPFHICHIKTGFLVFDNFFCFNKAFLKNLFWSREANVISNMASVAAKSPVRRRRVDHRKAEADTEPSGPEDGSRTRGDSEGEAPVSPRPGTFWLTRVVLLRATAFIYCEWSFDLRLRSAAFKCCPRISVFLK